MFFFYGFISIIHESPLIYDMMIALLRMLFFSLMKVAYTAAMVKTFTLETTRYAQIILSHAITAEKADFRVYILACIHGIQLSEPLAWISKCRKKH